MYVLFLLSRGLDLFQVSVVPAVFFIVSVFFEVPTGAFADLAGRKKAFLLSCLLRMVAFGMYAFAHHFTAFIAAESNGPATGSGLRFFRCACLSWLITTLAPRKFGSR